MKLRLPHYCGSQWLRSSLPSTVENWLDGNHHLLRHRQGGSAKTRSKLEQLINEYPWQWPQHDICFISDLHADTDALFDALIASGGIEKTGAGDDQFRLTKQGKAMLFIFGGDFVEKGPSNFRLLRAIKLLMDSGARVRILAGNHDVRILLGMRSVTSRYEPISSHFFIRMGKKAIPMLREIRDTYLMGKGALQGIPNDAACGKLLFPDDTWKALFSQHAVTMMSSSSIARELQKIEQKSNHFVHQCAKSGLSLREVYAAAQQWRQLFLTKKGEFNWFYKNMKLVYRQGSFLFVHAGIDDQFAKKLQKQGVANLNRIFKKQLKKDPFALYYGPECNAIRTKYRTNDRNLTRHGSWDMHSVGIHVIVHGHRNLHHGQRIALRKSMLHFECDITLDAHSRSQEGLSGFGGGVTLIQPEGRILGISSDYCNIKLFEIGRGNAA